MKKLAELVELGIISPVEIDENSWASPIVLVKKKGRHYLPMH